jgi:hypothetical protein
MPSPSKRSLGKRIFGRLARELNPVRSWLLEVFARREIRMPRRLARYRNSLRPGELLFPQNRDYKGILKLEIRGCGLKDKVYIHLATTIAYCLEENLYLDWDGDLEGYGNWSDWFEPFAGPRPLQKFPEILHKPCWKEMSPLFKRILNRYPPTFVREIWRPKASTLESVRELTYQYLPAGCPYAAVQIRRGDKLWANQIQRVSPEAILNATPEELETLFLATDDYTVVEELEAIGTKRLVTLCRPECRGSDAENAHFPDHSLESRSRETLRFLADLQMCISAEFFIRVVPNRKTALNGHGRNLQISDLISDLRERRNETTIR